MPPGVSDVRRRGRLPPTLQAAALCVAGCSAAPSQNILGSFFPAWLLCGLLGVGGAAVFHALILAAGLRGFLIVPALVYLAVAGAVALALWLLWFGG